MDSSAVRASVTRYLGMNVTDGFVEVGMSPHTFLVVMDHHALTAYGTDGSCTVVAQDEVGDLLVIIAYEGTFEYQSLRSDPRMYFRVSSVVTGLHLDRSHIAYLLLRFFFTGDGSDMIAIPS
jgi:hypothetical protein